jgi:hypothetical protein
LSEEPEPEDSALDEDESEPSDDVFAAPVFFLP